MWPGPIRWLGEHWLLFPRPGEFLLWCRWCSLWCAIPRKEPRPWLLMAMLLHDWEHEYGPHPESMNDLVERPTDAPSQS